MAIVTAIFAAAGLAQGLMSGVAKQDAANAENIQRESQAKLKHFQAVKETELLNKQRQAQYAWDMAQIAQLRTVEAQNAVDKAAYGAKLIESATRNLEINSGALRDQFVVEEQLRARQDELGYAYEQAQRVDEANNAVAQYMNQINQRGMEGRLLTQQLEAEGQELLNNLVLEEQLENFKYELNQLAAIGEAAEAKATYVTRQGGGKTSQRLALEAGQKLGRLMGEMEIKAQGRDRKVGLLSSKYQNEFATRMASLSLATENDMDRIKYTNTRLAADQALAQSTLEDLTMPTYQLAENQYVRELQSLQLETDQAFDEANTPYRQREYIDPMAPIATPNPMYIAPTKKQGPSDGAVIGSALIAGVKGAMSAYDVESNTFH